MTLAGSTALVTGAGRGLGRGIAEALAEAGAEVVLVARSREELDAVAAGIDGTAHVAPCDVTDLRAVAALAERFAVDVLVNNAGTNDPKPFTEVDEASYDRLSDLNVRATFFTTQAFARAMIARGTEGSIINVTSQMGHVGAANRTVYCTTKHAVEGLTKALAIELAPHGIRVNAVAPTYVRTPMTEPYLADAAFAAEVVEKIPLGRVGEVSDVTAAVTFLASPGARLITGTSLLVDGGYTAQ